MRDFSRDKVEKLICTKDTLVVRTSDLLPTLLFMQECWRKLQELTPDDEEWTEYNILTYYKPKQKTTF